MSSDSYHHGNLRAALISAARTMLEEERAEAIGLRQVARAAEVSPAAPYRHFDSREALLAAVAAQGFEELSDALGSVGKSDLVLLGETYLDFARKNPNLYRLMFGSAIDLKEHADLKNASENAFGRLKQAVAQASDPEIAAFAAWSLVHGLAMLSADGLLGPDFIKDSNTRNSAVRRILQTLDAGA